MAHSWANNFKYFKQQEDIQSIQNITKFYEKLLAIQSLQNITKFHEKLLAPPKQIIGLIEAKPSNESENDSSGYLKQYIRGLDQSLLKKLLKLFQNQTQ